MQLSLSFGQSHIFFTICLIILNNIRFALESFVVLKTGIMCKLQLILGMVPRLFENIFGGNKL